MRKSSIFHFEEKPSSSCKLNGPTRRAVEACIPRTRQAIGWSVVVAWGLILEGNLSAATALPGFRESVISGPWSNTAGIAIENNGRMDAWEAKRPLNFTVADAEVAAANVGLDPRCHAAPRSDRQIV